MAKKTTRPRATARKSPTSKKAPSAKKKAAAGMQQARAGVEEASPAPAGQAEVTLDRRRSADRRTEDATAEPQPPQTLPLERRQKVNRRRQIDPTTCERDYSEEEIEFMNALDDYKRKSGRMFPTCSEVLEVVRDLGYVKLAQTDAPRRTSPRTSSAAQSKAEEASAV